MSLELQEIEPRITPGAFNYGDEFPDFTDDPSTVRRDVKIVGTLTPDELTLLRQGAQQVPPEVWTTMRQTRQTVQMWKDGVATTYTIDAPQLVVLGHGLAAADYPPLVNELGNPPVVGETSGQGASGGGYRGMTKVDLGVTLATTGEPVIVADLMAYSISLGGPNPAAFETIHAFADVTGIDNTPQFAAVYDAMVGPDGYWTRPGTRNVNAGFYRLHKSELICAVLAAYGAGEPLPQIARDFVDHVPDMPQVYFRLASPNPPGWPIWFDGVDISGEFAR